MTVKRVVMPYTGTEIGGSHISSFTLAQALQRDHGIEVVVYVLDDSLIAEEARRRGLTVRPLRETRASRHNPAYDVWRTPARLTMLRREGEGVLLHSNDIASLQAWGPAARLLRMPVVYSNRAFNRPVLPNRLVWNMADRICCVSHAIRGHIDPRSQSRAVVIDNPFELGASPERGVARAALIADLNLEPDAIIIGFAANFWERKRPIFFLDACRVIGERHPNARFVVFGRAGDITQDMLQAHAAAIGIGDRTRFPGFRLPGEANIAAMDIHLIPALHEPFGRTPIESLLLGTPYVAMDDAGNAEIGRRFGGGKMLPPDASVAAFAEAALEAIADPAGTRLSEPRRAEVTRELSAANHVARMLEVYAGLDRARG